MSIIIEIAIGDAYGAGFEYSDPHFVQKNNNASTYTQHPKWKSLAPGSYTDDTQMSLAIAEHMIHEKPWTAVALADSFVNTFKRDKREGYARGFYEVLTRSLNGQDLLRILNGHGTSDKSGGAMRAGVIGLYPTIDEVLEKSKIQASITHNSPDGIAAAQASSLMVHYFHYDCGSKKNLGEFLETHVPGRWNQPWHGEVKSKGEMSVRAAITAIQKHDTTSNILHACIAYTGDVDTVAAIALGPASKSREIQQILPRSLYNNLENKKYGRDYLLEIDKQLLEHFK